MLEIVRGQLYRSMGLCKSLGVTGAWEDARAWEGFGAWVPPGGGRRVQGSGRVHWPGSSRSREGTKGMGIVGYRSKERE